MILISFIVPVYHGQAFIPHIIELVSEINDRVKEAANQNIELILVNDSPEEEIRYKEPEDFSVRLINNKRNLGIHSSRVNGLKEARGEWIYFLDQDDKLAVDEYVSFLNYLDRSDVIVANGFYQKNGRNCNIFRNARVQKYYLQEKNFLTIRNLIRSPGEVLIRKEVIPEAWKEHRLAVNGADDWMLWILLFHEKARFVANPSFVYIHQSTEAGNLSSSVEAMYKSSIEMTGILSHYLDSASVRKLKRAIYFKYLKDSGIIRPVDYFRYMDCTIHNVVYKAMTYGLMS